LSHGFLFKLRFGPRLKIAV